MRRVLSRGLALGILAGLCVAEPADAFSTRVHIAIANDVRQELIASGNASVKLKLSDYSVILSAEDAQAIVDNPLEFRAGAVGPDNMAFPGMTDPSHAIEQRPYEQCELLYQAALTPRERAYAAGCFLHGSTDAIAHHYVNYMSGETFTLNPITTGRQTAWDNVVRHIIAESMIQDSAFAQKPEAFTFGNLTHAIPKDFVLRAYLDEQSPLWQMMAARAKAHYDAAKANNPGASLVTVIGSAGLAPADHIVLSPVYLREIDYERQQLKVSIESDIKALQDKNTADGQTLNVTAGPDGQLGTSDDDTACSASCPTLYATYKVYVALLEPRYDASNNPLPSAFDKLSDELRDDLFAFLPAFANTVENVSNKLNEPLSPGSEAFNIDKSQISTLFAPLTTWSDDLTTIDYATLTAALLPDWLQDLQQLLNSVGVNIQVPNIIEALLDPVIQPVKDAIKAYAIDMAKQQVGELVDQYTAQLAIVKAEYQTRLNDAAPAGLGGTALDHLYDSGLYAHAFNIAAVAIANHEAVLPDDSGDPVGVGPASFDASHTPAWMQPGLCDYLRTAVFPLGIDVKAALSVQNSAGKFDANVGEDSPIECHDGSLNEFTSAPTVATCELVPLATLMSDPRGTVSRAHPPNLSDNPPTCRFITVNGLPPPPPGSGGQGGTTGTGGVSSGKPGSTGSDGGCGCTTAGSKSGSASWLLLLLAAGALSRRRGRRRPRRASALLALPLAVIGCGGDDGSSGVGGAGGVGGGFGGTGAQAGAAGSGATGGAGGTAGVGGGGAGGSSGAAQDLLNALGTSVWHGLQTRDGKERAFELRFNAAALEWAEIRNPYGPARNREMRIMQVAADGKSVHTTVITPPGWPITQDNGRQDDWTIELVGDQLVTTRNGAIETFDSGPWPAPTSGLTAVLRVFASNGPTADAFCNAGGTSSPDRLPIWEFARGKSSEAPVEEDIVAGVPLDSWYDPTANNQFAVTDVPGFDQLGGTELSDQYNFIVRYVGTVTHPGGSIAMREYDDDVRDAVWAWLGGKVGSSNTNDLFLEVHGHIPADITVDAPSGIFAAGATPIEVMILRCTADFQTVDVEINLANGGWQPVGFAPTTPEINDVLFPPAL